jgi:uncharacterized protein
MPTSSRIAALDVIRGVAVMGILVANLPGFALPRAAYFSPLAAGGTGPADVAAWAITFVLVEGKLRALFAMLFGASTLLVIERADAAGLNGAAIHLRRMAWLFVIGLAHLYLIWWGDILNQYALVGVAALLFVGAPVRLLVLAGVAAIAVAALDGAQLTLSALAARPDGTATQIAAWTSLSSAFGRPPAADLAREIAAFRGPLSAGIAWRVANLADPVTTLLADGAETLGYALLGMAGLRSGFLTGAWSHRRYVWIAAGALALTLPLYITSALLTIRSQFDLAHVIGGSFLLSTILRPVTVAGYVALVLLVLRPGGAISARVAATGRMALSNYLGSSIAMTALFYGWGAGQFARIGRADLYWLVPIVWGAMLLWSSLWLSRFAYGPVEWVWRSLTRWSLQPLRRNASPHD